MQKADPPQEISKDLESVSLLASQDKVKTGGDPRKVVMTLQEAKEVTQRRLEGMVSKNMDKCPLCQTQHFFNKSWKKVSPTMVTRMVSTHLTLCPKFIELSGEQRAAAVLAQSACLHCTA